MRKKKYKKKKHETKPFHQTYVHSMEPHLLKGEMLPKGEFGVIHGYMEIPQLKDVCHSYGCSINEYLVAVYVWSVYTECMKGMPSERPIRYHLCL